MNRSRRLRRAARPRQPRPPRRFCGATGLTELNRSRKFRRTANQRHVVQDAFAAYVCTTKKVLVEILSSQRDLHQGEFQTCGMGHGRGGVRTSRRQRGFTGLLRQPHGGRTPSLALKFLVSILFRCAQEMWSTKSAEETLVSRGLSAPADAFTESAGIDIFA